MSDMAFISPAFQWVVFICAAALALFGAIMMVTRSDPIHGALWLIVAFFSLAVIYLTLNAQFIAVAQVIVYAGAIMMLIIFVIMLIHLETGFALQDAPFGSEGGRRLHRGGLFSGDRSGRPYAALRAGRARQPLRRRARWKTSAPPFTASTSSLSR